MKASPMGRLRGSRLTQWGTTNLFRAARPPLPWPRSMLYLGPDGLGDTLVALPMLRRIRRESPHTRVTWMARAAMRPIVEMMGLEDFVAHENRNTLDLRSFDAIIGSADFDVAFFGGAAHLEQVPIRIGPQGARARPWVWNHLVRATRFGQPRHEAQRYLRRLLPFGHGAAASPDELCMAARLDFAPVEMPDDLAVPGPVVLHPFSNGHTRDWPLAHWIDVARRLSDSGARVVFTGSSTEGERLCAAWPRDRRPGAVTDATGRLSLVQLATLLLGARAVAAPSTGPLHLAAALGTPTLGLFPPRKGVAADRWAALGRAAVSVQSRGHCPRPRCRNDDCKCMAAIAPERVAAALQPRDRREVNLAPLAPYRLLRPCAATMPAGETTKATLP